MRKGGAEQRELSASTQLLRSDRVEAVVVVADDHDHAHGAGGAVVEYLIHALGREIPLVREDEYDATRRYRRRHVVAVGGFGNHRLLTRLYTQGHHYCDDRFPGEGGYVIRTMHRVDGGDRNVVMLAGGDAEGWADGTEALCDMLTGLGDRVTIPPTNCVVSRQCPPAPRQEQAADRLRELASAAKGDDQSAAMRILLDWLGSFDLGGNVLLGMLFRSGISLLQELERRGELEAASWRASPERWLGRMARLWGNAGERCVFDAGFRTRFGGFLLAAAGALEGTWLTEPRPRGRAWSGALLGFHGLGHACGSDGRAGEAREWRARANAVPGVDLSEESLHEPSAADQCRFILDMLTVGAELAPGTPEALSLARLGQEWVGTYCPPSADPAHFGPEAASASETRQIAGRTLWLRGPGHPASAECLRALEGPHASGAHYPPRGLYGELGENPIGVRWIGGAGRLLLEGHPVDPPDHERGDPRLLHAGASLRALARTHGEFALLGGTRLAPGSHADTNALLHVEYATRPFLIDLPGLGPEASAHGGVGLSVDGRPYAPPRLARARATLHAGRLRLVASETVDPGHPIWLRMLCHLPGRGFLIVDRVTPRESGSMRATFTFPMVGEMTLEHGGEAAVFSQDDAAVWLRQPGYRGFVVEAVPADLSSLASLGEAAPQAVQRVSWSQEWRGSAGVPTTFVTELRLHALSRRRALLLNGSQGGPWVCALPDEREITVGLDMEPLRVRDFEVDATAYVLESHLWLAGLRRLAFGGSYVETSAPCATLVNADGGYVRVTAAVDTDVYLSNEGDLETLRLDAGADVDLPLGVPRDHLARIAARVAAAAEA